MRKTTDTTELTIRRDIGSTELNLDQLEAVSGGSFASTILTNLANMKHEMLKAVASNLRA